MKVSIVIPVLDRLEFTRQCLDRIWRNTSDTISFEVVVVDNGSTDGTPGWFENPAKFPRPVRYHRNARNLGFAKGNNIGAGLAVGEYLLFLNNDTLVQPGWLSGMLRVAESDPSVGIVGIKQLFPYTNVIYHTGVVFAPGGIPQHLYPHLDASLPHVNQEREYQAVTGACLLIGKALFEDCKGFDDAYVNGYEDTDLCMQVRQRGRKIVCCTSAFIYHYGQISESRTAKDDENARLFASRWQGKVRIDQGEYMVKDRLLAARQAPPARATVRSLARDCIYLADDLGHASAFTWVNAELATSLAELGAPVFLSGGQLSPTVPAATRKRLARLQLPEPPIGGVQVKWSHYWPRHMNLELNGDINLEFFVINYLFGRPGSEPWDYWLQSLRQNGRDKLPVSEFCASVLQQVGISSAECHVLHHGYSREVHEVDLPSRPGSRYRFLTVTNSADLPRYATTAIIDAYERAFTAQDEVTLVVKDYGAMADDRTLRERLQGRARGGPPIEYITDFTDKRDLIRLYRSCDAFVSAHRGEGFGMKILDAMACGLPVITPLFGGPTAYCTPETCFPVDFSMVPVDQGVDSRSLPITNQPLWAEPSVHGLAGQMRRVFEEREMAAALGARARDTVLDRFSWKHAATRLIEITRERGANRPAPTRSRVEPRPAGGGPSPYWLGLRVSVIVPTHNRKAKLLTCLEALGRQSVLPQEFEVLVIDDGSTDGTAEAIASSGSGFPFALRYFRQESGGPGTARNLGIEQAAGELVLFIGDDILADERLLEEHLLAHASDGDPGLAVLGRIDWPDAMPKNAVMEYVCGDAALQFAYTLIPSLPALDHRFFYTSNISLKRTFLLDAADAGIRFDPCFRHAAFEDSEFAFRLIPRGLRISYVGQAQARHDHFMDLDSFAAREFRAGEMAVAFYRKHPGHDEHLQVRWMAELNGPVKTLLMRPDFLQHLVAFDVQTNTLLTALAGSLEALLALEPQLGVDTPAALSADRLRQALHNVLRVIFDVQRSRGKVQEWFSTVEDQEMIGAAQALASVLRKLEFLNLTAGDLGLPKGIAPLDGRFVERLRERIGDLEGPSGGRTWRPTSRGLLGRALRRVLANPSLLARLLAADRYVQARLQTSGPKSGLNFYRRVRSRIRRLQG